MNEKEYKYKAVSVGGEQLCGVWKKGSKKELISYLESLGYFLIEFKPVNGKKLYNKKVNNDKELYIFSQRLFFLISSGISLIDSINILKSENMKLEKLEVELNNGYGLYKSMEITGNFPKFYISIIKAGEISGNLEVVLDKLSIYYKNKYELNKNIKSKMSYPISLLIISIFIMFFILENIIPSFIDIFENMGGNIPSYTLKLITITNFFKSNNIKIKTVLVLFVILIGLFSKGFIFKRKKDYLFLNNLLLKKWTQKYNMIQLSSLWSILISSGISLYDSISISLDIVDNNYMKTEIKNILINLESGNGFGRTIEDQKYFSNLFKSLSNVGEESGKLDETLNWISIYYEKELEEDIEKLLKLLEPTLLIIVGLFIGFVMVSILIPMFEIGEIF